MSTGLAPAPPVPAAVAGSNRKHELARADWRYLLPSLAGARVLVIGTPSRGELRALSEAAERTVVACDASAASRVSLACVRLGRVRCVGLQAGRGLPFRSGAFDRVVFSSQPSLAHLVSPPPAHRDVSRVMTPDSAVYVPVRGAARVALIGRWMRACFGSGARATSYWTVIRGGAIRVAIPAASASALAPFFFRGALYGRSRRGRLFARLASGLARARLLHWLLPHRALVLTHGGASSGPFPFLADAARRLGGLPARAPLGLLLSGSYDSNKATFFVFDPATRRPVQVVKVTRTAGFNDRLDREYRALVAARARDLVEPGGLPEPYAHGTHDGLAVLVQSAVDGIPFRRATAATPDCPVAQRAIEWIVRLGSRSATSAHANRAILSGRFTEMLDELRQVYRVSDGEAGFLQRLIERLHSSHGPLPLVFRHGDAGSWNAVVRADGSVAFLDWENSEPAGPPLWDVIDFARSYVSWMSRVRGAGGAVSSFEALLGGDGAAAEMFVRAVHRSAETTAVARPDIEPLFYFYWVDRALRQAAWSAPADLGDAIYFQLLRLCIAQRHCPLLRRLFDGDDAVPPARPPAHRADWRFLLPIAPPARAALIGAGRSELAESLATVCESVTVLDDDMPPAGDADADYALVIVEHATPERLRRAVPRLRPGGCLYCEIDRRPGAGAGPPWPLGRFRDIERLLLDLGFESVQMHWHYPDFERCRCIIPVHSLEPGVGYLRRGGDKAALAVLAAVLRVRAVRPLVRHLLPCASYTAHRPLPETEVAR